MKYMLAHFGNSRLVLIAASLLLWLSVSASASAQSDDPLGKPGVWEKLTKNPKSNQLWSEYFGKDLFELSKEEGLKFRTWRSELITEWRKKGEVTTKVKIDGEATLNRLTNNIAKNFVLIEDYFGSEFKKMGAEYTTYTSKYPEGSYDKILWVEEHEKKLRELWHAP